LVQFETSVKSSNCKPIFATLFFICSTTLTAAISYHVLH
jgi:uncharacterized membrane protein